MILSLRPDAWETLLDALEEAALSYREKECTENSDEIRALAATLRELGRETLSGRLQGYRIPDALGKGGHDIVIEAVLPK